jgi:hypothetical protein
MKSVIVSLSTRHVSERWMRGRLNMVTAASSGVPYGLFAYIACSNAAHCSVPRFKMGSTSRASSVTLQSHRNCSGAFRSQGFLWKSRGLRPSRTRLRRTTAISATCARLGGGPWPLPPQPPPAHPPRPSCGTPAGILKRGPDEYLRTSVPGRYRA